MPKRTNNFQQLIHKIYECMNDDETIITESGEIWDHDGEILREVDILIERKSPNGCFRCMVECRDRSRKESIQWIDELIGKSRSLNVNKVIAVSSKGFAHSAIVKAKKNKIETHTLIESLLSDLPDWVSDVSFLLVNAGTYNLEIHSIRFYDINRNYIDVPRNAKELLVRERGYEELLSFEKLINEKFGRFVCDPTTGGLLHEAIKSQLKELMQYIVANKQKPLIGKSAFIYFDQYILYDTDKKRMPLQVKIIELPIMISMPVLMPEKTHYKFSGNYVSTYTFGDGGPSVVYVQDTKCKGENFNPNSMKVILPQDKNN